MKQEDKEEKRKRGVQEADKSIGEETRRENGLKFRRTGSKEIKTGGRRL